MNTQKHPALFLLIPLLTLLVAIPAPAAEPATMPSESVPWILPTFLARVPPLKHDATGRLPIITWEYFKLDEKDDSFAKYQPLPPEMYKELAKRGMTQRIPFHEEFIPMALAIQKAGCKVVVMEGNGGNGPGGEPPDSLHHLPADFKADHDDHGFPCPLLLEGWRLQAEKFRTILHKFKAAGVTIDAIWLDWEVEPFGGREEWREARACSRCQGMFPPGVLDDFKRYSAFMANWRTSVFTTYVAAPIMETYPNCSTTNWAVVISSVEDPTPSAWGNRMIPPVGLGMWTAANPVMYGNSIEYKFCWKRDWNWPLDVPHMDRLYWHVMLDNISHHEANALRSAPFKQSVPWVARYCPDDPDPKIPIMSRGLYREALRHAWLRGATSMQVFNALRPEHLVIATEEVEDVISVYDEMLAYRKLLDSGTVMNTAFPSDVLDESPIWSGLREGNEAVVRVFAPSPDKHHVSFRPFAGGPVVELECPTNGEGATYLLTLKGPSVEVKKQ